MFKFVAFILTTFLALIGIYILTDDFYNFDLFIISYILTSVVLKLAIDIVKALEGVG